MTPVNVIWGMVAYGPYPYSPVYSSHMRAIAYASRVFTTDFREAKIGGVGATDRVYTHSGENMTVEDFLSVPDATHLFLTEMDMVLPLDTITKLVALDKPIASGLYFIRRGRGQPCLYAKSLTPADNPYPHSPVTLFPTDRPFQMDPIGGGCPGLGCVLIKREVFETVPYPWFDLKESTYGSDMYFYTKVRNARIPVWVDPSVRCDHMDYTQATFADYEQRVQEDPNWRSSGFIIGAAHGG